MRTSITVIATATLLLEPEERFLDTLPDGTTFTVHSIGFTAGDDHLYLHGLRPSGAAAVLRTDLQTLAAFAPPHVTAAVGIYGGKVEMVGQAGEDMLADLDEQGGIDGIVARVVAAAAAGGERLSAVEVEA